MILLWLLFLVSNCFAIGKDHIINTSHGLIRGRTNKYGTSFANIPFAAPPVNELRWIAPQPLKSWNTILDATSTDNIGCPQSCSSGTNTYWCSPIISENCLLLNIWTPKDIDCNNKIPVLLYIYGGGFVRGVSNNIFINGTIMANLTNNIIVTINYRLGALGFLYDNDLSLNGNFGYLDQISGIKWVYNNIEFFCGDKDKIIIYGESAGASSVALHAMDTDDNSISGMITGAIMESLPLGQPLNTPYYWNTNNIPETFSEKCGCPMSLSNSQRLECLRSVDVNSIIQEQSNIRWTPTVDGNLIIDQPIFAFQKGLFNKNIGIIIGICSGEEWYFIEQESMSFIELENKLIAQFGLVDTNQITNFYNISILNQNVIDKYQQIYTDFIFKCSSKNISGEYSLHVNTDNLHGYYYQFDHVSSFINQLYGETNPYCSIDACHTAEIPYVWNDDLSELGIQFTNNERYLANQINFYWSNFAKTGNPNNGDWNVHIEWSEYKYDNRKTLIMDVDNSMRVETDLDLTVCTFWDSLAYKWVNIPIN